MELDPENAPALYNLGNALYMLSRLDDSVATYHKALALNSESPECHFNLASACNDLGKHSDAIKHYQEAIRILESGIHQDDDDNDSPALDNMKDGVMSRLKD